MPKAWDILPPRPKSPRISPPKQRRSSKNAGLFFGIILIVMVGFFLTQAAKTVPGSINGANTSSPNLNLEVTNTQEETLIKILGGSGQSEDTLKVKQILENGGFKIAKTENALNLYDQTIVYFQAAEEQKARQIAEILTSYRAKTQKFSQETNYDIVVVIGTPK